MQEEPKKRGLTTPIPELKNKEWLKQKYIDEQLTGQQIADLLDCTKHPVMKALKKHGLTARLHTSKYPQLNDKDWLRQKYVDEKLSLNQIATIVGTKAGTIHSALTHMKIITRNHKEGWGTKFPDGRYGEIASNWRGGISAIYDAVRTCTEYKEWRKAVFKRDHYTCVQENCGSKDQIEADHIKQFAVIIRENNIRSMEDALACTELWDINNGRTLCHECHLETESHSKRLEPINLENDTRTEIEKKIDKLYRKNSYYQKRNWQLQERIIPKLRNKIKDLETTDSKLKMDDASIEAIYDKRIGLLEDLLTANNIPLPPIK